MTHPCTCTGPPQTPNTPPYHNHHPDCPANLRTQTCPHCPHCNPNTYNHYLQTLGNPQIHHPSMRPQILQNIDTLLKKATTTLPPNTPQTPPTP